MKITKPNNNTKNKCNADNDSAIKLPGFNIFDFWNKFKILRMNE